VSEGGYNWNGGPNEAKQLSLSSMARHVNDAAARWPTPTAKDADSSGARKHGPSLTQAARLWPTPLARDARSYRGAKRMPNSQGSEPLVVAAGGRLNPTWVEWLMGAPLGWTDPDCELSATELSPTWATSQDGD